MVLYVLDTSYLDELAKCDGKSDPVASERVRGLFAAAVKARARFFVPLPCLFELGNHIAQVTHDQRRQKLADWLASTVKSSLIEEKPWIITPTGDPKLVLPKLLDSFCACAVKNDIGLVDTFIVGEANRLKDKYRSGNAKVHIWTNERALKAQEPDQETHPYHW